LVPPSRDISVHQLAGIASYYAEEFNGRPTASGEQYDMHALTAAHRTLPFNSMVRVTSVSTGQSVVVRINDRGPFKDDRVIDLSLAAAQRIGLIAKGTGSVTLEVLPSDGSK
jgi:rare lipoprotein A